MTFIIGQIFENKYPPEVAVWCGNNNARIQEFENISGNRRFQIVAIPQPTNEELQVQIQEELTSAVQQYLDSKAQELLYDNCLSVCSYIDTGVSKFDAEGRAFRAWRSAVWAKGYEILAQVQAGQRAIPTEEQLIAELPQLVINY